MKGLYCRLGQTDADTKFVIQEMSLPANVDSHQVRVKMKACGLSPLDLKLLVDLGIQRDLIPVGREVAGVVLQVGSLVSSFHPDDEVVGILPLDSPWSGLCDVIDVDEHLLVHKPEKLSWICVAGAIRDGVCAYTALHTHARMAAGHTLLVMDGASTFGLLCIQLASYHGVKVLATSHTPEQHTFLEKLQTSLARVIPVFEGSSDLLSDVLEETGGLGVDIVIDTGVRLQEDEGSNGNRLPHKHEVISVLGVGGHWVTSHQELQLDPPDCRLLHLKSASVTFLNQEVWTASTVQQGRYLHILKDIMEKMSSGILGPEPEEAVPLQDATVVMEMVQRCEKKSAIVQF
ncbi:quinone oxidoreductase-like protein 1 isoform X2 [Gadus morhua]|uniref:Crystallin, zeta (quinone reductase)-like 1 n=1 Tax=Gadus morhua TaxID=8049 RepID=A0A8C4Z9K7_GADMO|nr:quinone oxidoreductase-like protein 1 isoform X2 [Gadus morhua]